MTTQQEVAGSPRRRPGPADVVRAMSYEVMPFRGTEQNVLEHVPPAVPLTVTVTDAKGLEPTLDLTERLLRHGYQVAPHLAARQFTDRAHVADVVARLDEAGARSVFVIGGDAPHPAGPFADAHSLLLAMAELGHPFTEVGIGGYPEGHANIPAAALDNALREKAPLATRVITQICFDAAATGAWAAGISASGVDLPVHIGLPGPVNRQKLVRISAGIGLGQSARFLRKQQNLVWRLLLPHGYEPTKLARRLAAVPGNIAGLHVFTFNELAKTEAWRRELLARLDVRA
ncbi:methylenetetrahydrofolate reductase [Amycolatopsis rhabdoformis]|uniref:Methylenetetrahydrofolate reductase n=1 Tax=Amycolatopsis rhabdoformis TaxID=1448059 RepID=A0ABZ1IL46_9PSEU|nr:methylenetetrahydrofolate reductase [Amycolatopsis rhabdoformis]WSE34910.1 methylenetetrahydrofolate reductase [Amycolatopsis rhabdoformis]